MSVAFRVAAGPRLGFGHLIRCRSLARALRVDLRVSLRGSASTRHTAEALGWTLLPDTDDPRQWPASVLVVDDPSSRESARWVARARRGGLPVATLHDAGLAHVASDLSIDGGVIRTARQQGARCLQGPMYAVLDPSVHAARLTRPAPQAGRVLIALGGGAHVLALASALAAAVAARVPAAEVRVARGFAGGDDLPAMPAGTWVHAPDGLAHELSAATVAIVAGGVTLFEACALGVPSVAIAVARAQHRTVRAMAARKAAIDGGLAPGSARSIARLADGVARLMADGGARARLATTAMRVVDAGGVWRVASAVRALARRGVANAA